jgi:hypothetical protein
VCLHAVVTSRTAKKWNVDHEDQLQEKNTHIHDPDVVTVLSQTVGDLTTNTRIPFDAVWLAHCVSEIDKCSRLGEN